MYDGDAARFGGMFELDVAAFLSDLQPSAMKAAITSRLFMSVYKYARLAALSSALAGK